MPNVRNVDRSAMDGTERWVPPPSLPVCEPTQVLDRRTNSSWPFLYSYREDGSVSVNRGAKKTHYQQALTVGEAQF